MAEIEIGILTRGKPTLGMTLTSLLLQQVRDIRIYIVDTSETPVIHRDDVAFALRLAFDRRIPCNYEYLRERDRAFSRGRLRILEALKGHNLCFMDDDIVLPSSSLARLLEAASSLPEYGFVAPYLPALRLPGGLFLRKCAVHPWIHLLPGPGQPAGSHRLLPHNRGRAGPQAVAGKGVGARLPVPRYSPPWADRVSSRRTTSSTTWTTANR